jgi:hypothetical protein
MITMIEEHGTEGKRENKQAYQALRTAISVHNLDLPGHYGGITSRLEQIAMLETTEAAW